MLNLCMRSRAATIGEDLLVQKKKKKAIPDGTLEKEEERNKVAALFRRAEFSRRPVLSRNQSDPKKTVDRNHIELNKEAKITKQAERLVSHAVPIVSLRQGKGG